MMMFLLLSSGSVQAQTTTVNWLTTYQTIEGFGVSDHQNGQPALSSAQSTFLFSPTNGIGLSLLRVGTTENGSCSSISLACAQNPDNGAGGNTSDAQACIANGCRVWATSWTPPASMKSNNSTVCTDNGGNGTLLAASYGAFATYLSNYIASMKTYYSIPLYAISVQNEPDGCSAWDGAVMSAAEFDTFIKTNLGPTLAANGQTSTLIMMPETSYYSQMSGHAGTCMSDSSCAAYVGINAFHEYDNPSSPSNPYASQNKQYWETEVSSTTGSFDTSITDALTWAHDIHLLMINNANAWHWWNTQQVATTGNYGLYGPDNTTIAKRAYAIGNWSKFVRPGWIRIEATPNPQTDVYVTAFKDGAGNSFAIVVANTGTGAVTQTFSLSGFPSSPASVTPTITDGSLNLAQQSSVGVSGSSFSYTLPTQSVTTFVGVVGDTDPAPVVSPPTRLTAAVQ
jgi:glucuronoarabinoxylan endo-1,4-beta-xylanase